MHILFFENNIIWDHLLPNGFQEAGHQIKISGRLTEGQIPKMIQEFKPDLIITMGWGLFQTPNYQKWIGKYVKQSKIPHVFWSVEDPGHTHNYVLPLTKTVAPDFIFTICKSRVDYFKKHGMKAAHMEFAYNPNIHYPTNPNPEFNFPIAVVACPYLFDDTFAYRNKAMQNLISPLIKNNMQVNFWGEHANRYWNSGHLDSFIGSIPNEWVHQDRMPYYDTNKLYNSADIILGLQNHHDQVTQRTFEVLGSGGFLLTCDTLGIRNLFKPGKDLVVSSSPQETLELVLYYLARPEERNKIRKQGQLAVKKHTYKNRAQYMIDVLKKESILPGNIK